MDKIGAVYLFDSSFQETYPEKGWIVTLISWMKCHLDFKLRKMQVHYMKYYLVHSRMT
jgi:hypothetical protein